MARKQEKFSRRMLFTCFMLTGGIFLFIPQSFTGKFQLAFVDIFRWPLSLGGNVALTARTQESYDESLGGGIQRYQNVIDNLEQTIAEYRRKFQMQHKYTSYVWEGAHVAEAAVIELPVDGPSNELTIDYRKKIGLAKGQYVLGGESIIGTISDVFPQIGTARVKLITDSTSQIPVKIGNGNLRNIMKGTGGNVAVIEQIKKKVDVGERIFALRKPGFLDLDAPIITGRVSRCERNPKQAAVWDVTVVPVCDIESLENVVVIIINPKAG